MENLLCRKDIARLYGVDRVTVYRWERRDGMPMRGGRISETRLIWWMEQRDAARALHMNVKAFLAHSRSVREQLLAAATAVKSDHDKTNN